MSRSICRAVAVIGLAVLIHGVVCAEPLFKAKERVPSDAIVLFDGQDLSKWVKSGTEDPAGWTLVGKYMEVKPGTGNICTKQEFTDFQFHLEFWLPLMADAKGQARANSGIFMQGSYEIQVLDSYGLKSDAGDCGAIYSQTAPMVNANRPPEQWQTYDVIFHAPKFDDKGNQTGKARISVLQNGVWIHDNVEISGPTHDPIGHDVKKPGPILLQDHGSLIRYRNIWIRPL